MILFYAPILIALCLPFECRAAAEAKKKTRSPVILVSLDGFGWQFAESNLFKTPNLDFIAKTGVKAKFIKPVTPTVTWPNHHTYLTGLYPESHGIIANRFWDPVYKEKFIFEFDCSNNDPKFWNESEPIWLSLQKGGQAAGMYYWPGYLSYETKPTYYEDLSCALNCSAIPSKDLWKYRNKTSDTWPDYEHCHPNFTQPFPDRFDKVMTWLQSDNPPQFVAFYVEQPDFVGHSDGPESDKFKEMVEFVDRTAVGYIIQTLRLADMLDKVNLIFVSDHSFTTVNKSRVIFWEDFLDLSASMLTESGTFAHIWPKPGQFDEVYKNLTMNLVGRYPQVKVYKKEDTPEAWHYRNNRRIPPIYVDPGFGWTFMNSRAEFNVSDDWVHGVHGYPSREAMGAIFYARGPDFKKGYSADRALDAVDLYPLMCEILGLEPRPNNGSLESMADFMASNDPGGVGGISSFVFIVVLNIVIARLLVI